MDCYMKKLSRQLSYERYFRSSFFNILNWIASDRVDHATQILSARLPFLLDGCGCGYRSIEDRILIWTWTMHGSDIIIYIYI